MVAPARRTRHAGRARKSEQGFTLTEVSIVMVVIIIIAAGIITAMSALSNKRLHNQLTDQLGTIVSNMRGLYSGRNLATVDATVTTATLATQGIFPNEMTAGGVPQNAWRGTVTVAVIAPTSTTPAEFSVSYANIPFVSCVELLVQNSQTGRDSGLAQVALTGTSTTHNFISDATNHDLPILPTAAATACSADTAPFTIKWTYILGNGCVAGTPC